MQALCTEAGFIVERWTTVSCIAPWLAPISWRLATRMHRIEQKSRLLVGAILVCVLSRD